MSRSQYLKSFLALLILVTVFAGTQAASAQTVTSMTSDQFLSAYKSNLAADGENEFTRLTDANAEVAFRDLLDALLAGDTASAQDAIDDLALLSIHYQLIELTDAPGPLPVLGFRESVSRSNTDFKGWGPVLVRPHGALDVVYQAPHPIDDQFTEGITLDAYLEDCCAAVAIFSGSRRHSNGDSDGDGEDDSDVAHDTENLFHLVTEHLATSTASDPAFYVQVHAAANRSGEPIITASDGDDRSSAPPVTNGHPLVPIDDAVADDGFLKMGICGYSEGSADDEDGDYRNCATFNIQGNFLESVGQRESFMHFELQRSARDDYDDGVGAGFDGIRGLFTAVRATLGPELRALSTTAPATACQGQALAASLSATVANAGDANIAGNFLTAWYLSDDEIFDSGDQMLGSSSTRVYTLAAGASIELIPDLGRIPTNASMGSQYLLAVVDIFDQISERLEGNNVTAHPITVDCTLLTDFENTFSSGWTQNTALTTANTGTFGFGRPNEVVVSGFRTQVGQDHTLGGLSGTAYYTHSNTSPGVTDVDGGVSVVESPSYTIATDSDVSIWYFHGQRDTGGDSQDYFRIETSINGGPFTSILALGDQRHEATWEEATVFVAGGSSLRFRVSVSDGSPNGDLIEAGLDDITARPR